MPTARIILRVASTRTRLLGIPSMIRRVMFLCLAVAAVPPAFAVADPPRRPQSDTAGLGGRPGRWDVRLEPTTRPAQGNPAFKHAVATGGLELGRWRYRVQRNVGGLAGVPWTLFAEPLGDEARRWQPSATFQTAGLMREMPVVQIPDVLWEQWFDGSMQDVVGIHYHEFVTSDLARVLVTIHKEPPDGPNGRLPADKAPLGTRLEATLMTPVTYGIDQTLMVRRQLRQEGAIPSRIAHEQAHAEVSLNVLLETLAGPQDWNPESRAGRRSTLAWYWRKERIGRGWDGCRDGRQQFSALRTSIALVPPTRWSKLLPKPPQDVSLADLQAFNDEVVHLDAAFAARDRAAQDRLHRSHGAYEAARAP